MIMKSKKKYITLLMLIIIIMPLISFGANLSELLGVTAGPSYGDTNEESLVIAIGKMINIVLSFLGVIFLILLIYSGFMWMTARGNEGQVESSKKIMVRAIIGVIIILVSFIITWFVMGNLSEVASEL